MVNRRHFVREMLNEVSLMYVRISNEWNGHVIGFCENCNKTKEAGLKKAAKYNFFRDLLWFLISNLQRGRQCQSNHAYHHRCISDYFKSKKDYVVKRKILTIVQVWSCIWINTKYSKDNTGSFDRIKITERYYKGNIGCVHILAQRLRHFRELKAQNF